MTTMNTTITTSLSLKTQPDPAIDKPILFVGNAPYRNRGCEAILRGTMEILQATFGTNIVARAGVMAAPNTVTAQQAAETDQRVSNFSVSHVGSRFSAKWWKSQANVRLGANIHAHVHDLNGHSDNVAFALQLGGDNYSLDYGRPWDYIAVDRFLQKRGIPVFIWGASVGPFEKDVEFAPKMYAHLKTLNGIFVRESSSRDYLAHHGIIDNVHLVADPAFVMTPVEPMDPAIRDLVRDGPIGINISPLAARFSHTGGDLAAWRQTAADMIVAASEKIDSPILLVPHVGSPKPDEDDFAFMTSLEEIVTPRVKAPVRVVPSGLSAAELKWLIAHCLVFAGSRTHSTIAALSSAVPTLSLSYSVKAIGINQDIFGHQKYCKSVKTISAVEFADTLQSIVNDSKQVRAYLESKLPAVRSRALNAGTLVASTLAQR